MGIHLEPFRYLRDVYEVLYLDIRMSDVKEIKALTGESPQEALANIINYHDALYLIKDDYDRTLGILGIIPSPEHSTMYKKAGEVVFLCTDELFKKYKYEILKRHKDLMKFLIHAYDYDVIFNYTNYSNNLKWLEYMGFEVFKDTEVFFEDPSEPFYFFRLERS